MNVMGIIFANEDSIGTLTDKRTMASLPFGARYRQVDFALSNLTCAGVRHIGIISRHSYQSLMHHIGSGEEWGLELGEGGLEFLTPFAQSTQDVYRGKLDSLNTAMDFLTFGDDEYAVLIDSAIVSNFDLNAVIAAHVASGKDVTVVTKTGICNGEKDIDLALKLGENGEIVDIVCNSKASADYLASMDVFVASKPWLINMVEQTVAHGKSHLDRDLIMGGWQDGTVSVNTYAFEGIALYNESQEEYYANTLSLLDKDVRADIFGGAHPVWTKVRDRVPCYYGEDVEMENVLIADGCVIEGEVEDSVLFRQVTVEEDAEVENCIIFNDCVIGKGAEVKYAILDKDVVVTAGAKLCGTKNNPIIVKKGQIV
ncbi:MAG: glucose-1-phosphate adenylyltransferase subunit GlgD [Oscillospiraceae bacterium]|nr:glucose-1-phosphate adenylyltransferase subunit GlgD [Oscillospiraceae bacterium]